jgi:hypothetical protein
MGEFPSYGNDQRRSNGNALHIALFREGFYRGVAKKELRRGSIAVVKRLRRRCHGASPSFVGKAFVGDSAGQLV